MTTKDEIIAQIEAYRARCAEQGVPLAGANVAYVSRGRCKLRSGKTRPWSYRTRTLTPKHAEYLAAHGGTLYRSQWSDALAAQCGLLGTVLEEVARA